MGNESALKTAIDELEALHRSMGEVVRDGRDGWRLHLVQHRRQLSNLVGRIAVLVDASDRERRPATEEHLALRAKLTTFRSALAMHQASYPAVSIIQETSDYRASVDHVRAASSEFCGHARRTLKFK